MSEFNGYAVYLYPKALESLGEAITPYLQDADGDAHVLCREIDTSGNFIELTLDGHTRDGQPVDLDLMLPTSMARMIVSAHSDPVFGFGPRMAIKSVPAPSSKPKAGKADAGGKSAGKKPAKKSAKKSAKQASSKSKKA